ncbi:DAK2 domain-containing protein [Rhodococcus rhodochrous]|uniref:DAK2 domain-containing protein n=1 Tax=Rhodococcus rhodochrous TaxID=1829 RepID=UPI001E4DCC3E|nr:DAK2 domain-containing protein [Rhodococcus rhodochrous]MCD2095489.1 DAK2 domain-containing protein [Rhodococcus rhodochrous]MCD2120079.1 DAK2 domain-containing protein [Rhodococcus rhodochrous]MCQ4134356.1 DAK2 domain-containing protein [Rhodococcus rhodochrous]MDJ0016944.1 DAK2 domain-containing protein [Rhodococcus rhodochrous]
MESLLGAEDTVDGRALRRWVEFGVEALEQRRAEINSLNVFPVPDGDTGNNLLITLQAAAARIGGPVDGALTASDVAEGLARGAFAGARGNSGIILAQALRGVADAVAGLTTVGARDLAAALSNAATLVTGALSAPAKGTIVSVLEAAADGATRVASETDATVCDVAVASADAAADALQRTTTQLDVLAEAGVVDAGGLGLLVLLDCLVEVTTGTRPDRRMVLAGASRPVVEPEIVDERSDSDQQEYEVMYLVGNSDDARIDALRSSLDALGDSVAIVAGESGCWSVHVHCCDPGAAVEAGLAAGSLSRIDITCFALESARRGCGDGPVVSAPVRAEPAGEQSRAVLAVVGGEGAAELFEAEGARVLRAEEISVHELLEAIRALPSRDVLVLPNGALSAQDVVAVGARARRDDRDVMFLPSSSVVQGLASLAVHDPMRATVDDAFAMSEAAACVRWGSLRYANERALTWVGTCEPGDSLGLAGHDVVVIEHDLVTAGASLLDRILAAGGELVTMLVGADAPDGLVEQLAAHLDRRHPEIDVAVYQGGQRSDLLQLGVE